MSVDRIGKTAFGVIQANVFSIVQSSQHVAPFDCLIKNHLKIFQIVDNDTIDDNDNGIINKNNQFGDGASAFTQLLWLTSDDLIVDDEMAVDKPSSKKIIVKKLKPIEKLDGTLTTFLPGLSDHPLLLEAAFQYVLNITLPQSSAKLFGIAIYRQDPVLVMEFIEGDLATEFEFSEEKFVHITAQLCVFLGLKYLLNISHGDFHIHNLLVTGDNVLKVIDFGQSSNTANVTVTTANTNSNDSLDVVMRYFCDKLLALKPSDKVNSILADINRHESCPNMKPGCIYWLNIARKYGAESMVGDLVRQASKMVVLPTNMDYAHKVMEVVNEVVKTVAKYPNDDLSFELMGKLVDAIINVGGKTQGSSHKFFMLKWNFCGIYNTGTVLLSLPDPFMNILRGLMSNKRISPLAYILQPLARASIDDCIETPLMLWNRKSSIPYDTINLDSESQFLFGILNDKLSEDSVQELCKELHIYWYFFCNHYRPRYKHLCATDVMVCVDDGDSDYI